MNSPSQNLYNVEDLRLLRSILRGSEGVDRLDPHLLAELQRKLDKMYESPVKWIESYLTEYGRRMIDTLGNLMVEVHKRDKALYFSWIKRTDNLTNELSEFIDLVADFKELEDDN